MDQSFVDRLENVTQELHTAKQQINILNATVAHLTSENSDLHNELSALTEKEKDGMSRLKSVSDMCQVNEDKNSDLTDRLQQAVEEKEKAEKNVEELTSLVSTLQEKHQTNGEKTTSMLCMCETDRAPLLEKLSELEAEMTMKKDQLASAVADLQKALEKNSNMKDEMEDLQQELECLQSQFTSQCDIIQCQREELHGIKSESDDLACLDVNRKGNSLFSEVEDRRVIVETKLVKTLEKVNKLETRLRKEQKENQRLKNQVSLMLRTSNNKTSDKTVRILEQDLENSKKEVIKLTEQLAKASKSESKPSIELVSSQSAADKDVPMISYLKSTVLNLQKERDELLKEKNSLQLQCVQSDFLWSQKKNEVRHLTSEKEKLTALNAHLSMLVESLKSESDSTEDTGPKEMVKLSPSDPMAMNAVLDSEHKQENYNGADEVFAQKQSTDNSNNKENYFHDLKTYLLGSKSKSVAFSDDSNVLTNEGDQSSKSIKKEYSDDGSNGKSSKLKKSDGRGKYRTVNYVNVEDVKVEDEQAPDCKQQ